jgi:hypothetical protein
MVTPTPTKGSAMTDTAKDSDQTYNARETWLAQAVEQIRPKFEEIGFPVPYFRIGVGFGPQGGRKENKVILGITLATWVTDDRVNEVWISPEDADTGKMLGTVVHEMIHVAIDNAGDPETGNQHAGRFAEAATRIGLEGPMTATHAGADLLMELELIAASLGPYPGSKVDLSKLKAKMPVGPDGKPVRGTSGPKTQTTRLIKVVCKHEHADTALDGYNFRITQKWITAGLPQCPDGHPMELG